MALHRLKDIAKAREIGKSGIWIDSSGSGDLIGLVQPPAVGQNRTQEALALLRAVPGGGDQRIARRDSTKQR
jgi:hypothetical protein